MASDMESETGLLHWPDQQDQSPLFRLPREVRDKIYEEAAEDHLTSSASNMTWDNGATATAHSRRVGTLVTPFPALLQTCQRVRDEAESVLLGKARIDFYSSVRADPRGHALRLRSALTVAGDFQPSTTHDLRVTWYPKPADLLDDPLASRRLRYMPEDLWHLFDRGAPVLERASLRFAWTSHWSTTEVINSYSDDCDKIWRLLERVVGRFVQFFAGQPELRVLELQGVFPAHWITRFQERLPCALVLNSIDPPPAHRPDLKAWVRHYVPEEMLESGESQEDEEDEEDEESEEDDESE